MKNLKVSMKLLVGFLIVAILCALTGMVGIIGMLQMNQSQEAMYDDMTEPLTEIAKALEFQQRIRVGIRNIILNTGDSQALIEDERVLNDRKQQFERYAAEYRETIFTPSALQLFDDAMTAYHTTFSPVMVEVLNGAKAGLPIPELTATLGKATVASELIVDNLTECMEMKVTAAQASNVAAEDLFRVLLILIIVTIVVAVGMAMFMALYITGLIAKPLVPLTAFMKRASESGTLTMNSEEKGTFEKFSANKDEIGQCLSAASAFMEHIQESADVLEIVSGGDISMSVSTLSGEDAMGNSMSLMVDNLNNMFSEINNAATQVSTGSGQIADAAQSLAQGSTEQAATVQQLSASMTEIAEKTRDNAEMASKAATLANSIKTDAERGSHQMDEMMSAVEEINQASQNISKVIKVIDNIAFQTNILALNAAVEAARAGQHGRGFSVVAEEVRNLAAKSADAAQDTGELIANSMEKAELGARIASETAASLREIVSGINESTQIIGDIASSSDQQTVGIAQINSAVDQVAIVIQQNSATSEECAASSQQLSGQAEMLDQLIARFKLRNSGTGRGPSGSGKSKQPAYREETGFALSDKGMGAGKY
ncbi:MAG: methyl-accepting chemotaxis protein [Oscillospiraceae bacterium]|nr:methyl-accepting chemotaxis protein [Oscillospiraceae bacterium]